MQFEISQAKLNDLTELFAIERQAHQFPQDLALFSSNFGENYYNLKISTQQKVVGFAICNCLKNINEASLYNIAIDPKFQAQGLGKQLLTRLIDDLTQQNIFELFLEVRKSNLSAINLYLQLGFNQIDIRKNYYPSDNGREDAVIMALYLG